MLIFAVSNQTTKHMKLSTYIIALDFEHQRDYFPTEMGVTIINNDFTVGDTYHYYMKDEHLSKNLHNSAKTFLEVWEELHHLFQKDVLIVSHNHSTEKKVINQCFKKYGINEEFTSEDFFDTMWIIPAKLNVVCQSFNIPTDNHHQAGADSRMTAEIFCKYINRFSPDYQVLNEDEISDTGQNGFDDYKQMIEYETELIRYSKRNNIDNSEILSWLGNGDSERIAKLLDGEISEEFDDTIETDSDYWELDDCTRNENSLKYIYDMRVLNGQPMIPEILIQRIESESSDELTEESVDDFVDKLVTLENLGIL